MSWRVHGTSPLRPDAEGDADVSAAAPGSERRPVRSLSETLWGIRWSDLLPLEVARGITVRKSSYDAALPFVREHYASIFEERDDGPFSSTRVGARKETYYRVAGDFFEFVEGDRVVGLLICTPVDWSTYYVRSAAVLPEASGKKIIQRFFPPMFEMLARAGVERIEADTSPSNMATLHLLTRLRFNVTGTTLSDRWGGLVHFTRFLDPTSERTFLDQYCTGVSYQLRGPGHSAGEAP